MSGIEAVLCCGVHRAALQEGAESARAHMYNWTVKLIKDNIHALPDVQSLIRKNMHALPSLGQAVKEHYTTAYPPLKTYSVRLSVFVPSCSVCYSTAMHTAGNPGLDGRQCIHSHCVSLFCALDCRLFTTLPCV